MDYGMIALGSAAILAIVFVPGIALCYALFPKRGELNLVERVGLSFILGLTPTFLLYALEKNLSVPITMTTTFTALGLVTLVGVMGYKIRKPVESD